MFRGGTADTDSDGRGELDFDPPVTLRLNIRSASATDWEVAPTGPVDDVEWRVLSATDQDVTDGDRVRVDMNDGEGEVDYQVVETAPINFDGDQLRWHQLIPDGRGEEVDSPDTPGDDGSTDDGSDSGGSIVR